ncbi:MAG TPA: DUF6130 family protein [Actinomycetota bacterium]|nr:DUF6130 family protein [Actinomycetota bacterium]
MRRTILTVGLSAALALGACGDSDGSDPAGPVPIERPNSTAELEILEPAAASVVEGSTVRLRIRLEGARIVPETTTDVVPDEGHLHVMLDEELISMTEGLDQSIPDVAPGPHRITVEFVASDHAPFDPRVVAITTFEVAP